MAGKFTCWEDLTGRLLQVSRRGVPIWLLSTRPWVPGERSHPTGKQVRVKSAIVVRNELRPHCIESAGAPVHVARLQLFAPSSRLPELGPSTAFYGREMDLPRRGSLSPIKGLTAADCSSDSPWAMRARSIRARVTSYAHKFTSAFNIADMAALEAGSSRSRMTPCRH